MASRISDYIVIFISSPVYLLRLFCQHKHNTHTCIHKSCVAKFIVIFISNFLDVITSPWLCLSLSDIFLLSNRVANFKQKVYILSISPLSYPSWKILLFLSFPSMDRTNSLLGFFPRWVVSCLIVYF